ncbi:MAG: CoA transferase subunit A [Dehalococcoidia bacterium]|nr:CoA transferase subunit A [Dehalococcoidia bacterium]MSQ16318.1 CoA transferase subunit A [Dehalococcoidia bacterium]
MAKGKVYPSAEQALADIFDGAVVLVGGFAGQGVPEALLEALSRQAVKDLTCICSPAMPRGRQSSGFDVARLVASGRVSKVITPLLEYPGANSVLEQQRRAGQLTVEVVPQGVLAERLRAGGAGLGGVFLPNGAGTRFEEGKETREFDGQRAVLELPIRADFALVRAQTADLFGNLIYQGDARNWGPVMAMAAAITIAQVDRVVEPGGLDPERVITPGIFVHRIIAAGGATGGR